MCADAVHGIDIHSSSCHALLIPSPAPPCGGCPGVTRSRFHPVLFLAQIAMRCDAMRAHLALFMPRQRNGKYKQQVTRTETAKRTEAPKWRTGVGRYQVRASPNSQPNTEGTQECATTRTKKGLVSKAGWHEFVDCWEEDDDQDDIGLDDDDDDDNDDDDGGDDCNVNMSRYLMRRSRMLPRRLAWSCACSPTGCLGPRC
jgi:hypothetical protein